MKTSRTEPRAPRKQGRIVSSSLTAFTAASRRLCRPRGGGNFALESRNAPSFCLSNWSAPFGDSRLRAGRRAASRFVGDKRGREKTSLRSIGIGAMQCGRLPQPPSFLNSRRGGKKLKMTPSPFRRPALTSQGRQRPRDKVAAPQDPRGPVLPPSRAAAEPSSLSRAFSKGLPSQSQASSLISDGPRRSEKESPAVNPEPPPLISEAKLGWRK